MEELTEEEILKTFDSSLSGTYSDFINLNHGYFELANSRLSLFKDGEQWAMVFEKIGYNYRSGAPVGMEIYFFGNCLRDLDVFNGQESNYDYLGVPNNIDEVLEANGNKIIIRDSAVIIPTDLSAYKKYGIEWDFDGKNYPGAVLKWLAEEHPDLTRATDKEVMRCIPKNLKKIMVLDEWYNEPYSKSEVTTKPSNQKTFQMLAKVLVTGDTTLYKPVREPNTHWSFYPESGGL